MKFGPTPLDEARGAILAHTLRLPGRVIKKGTALSEADLDAMRTANLREVIAATLQAGDVPEDEAAERLAQAMMAPLLAKSRAATGRVNLLADAPGLLVLDVAAIGRLNALDESITIATLPNHTLVSAREMLATIKIIPFAVPGPVLAVAEAMLRSGGPSLRIMPLKPLKVGLVVSELPGLKQSAMEGAAEVTGARVEALQGSMLPVERVRHETPAIADALARLRRAGAELLLIAGCRAGRHHPGRRRHHPFRHAGRPGQSDLPGPRRRCARDGTARLRPQPQAERVRLGAGARLRWVGGPPARRDGHGRGRITEGNRHASAAARPRAAIAPPGAGATPCPPGGGGGDGGRAIPPHGAAQQTAGDRRSGPHHGRPCGGPGAGQPGTPGHRRHRP